MWISSVRIHITKSLQVFEVIFMRGAKIIVTDAFLSNGEGERRKKVREIIIRYLVKEYAKGQRPCKNNK